MTDTRKPRLDAPLTSADVPVPGHDHITQKLRELYWRTVPVGPESSPVPKNIQRYFDVSADRVLHRARQDPEPRERDRPQRFHIRRI